MLRKILIGVAVVLVVLVLVVATRPSTFHIQRSIAIAALPARVFATVNDLRTWREWSPWEKLDPNLKRTFDGPSAGPGAVYAWSGDANVGEGRMTIVSSEPPSHVGIRLEFVKPFAATNAVDFTFAPTPTGTTVTWSMEGRNNFVSKAVSLVLNMDKMVGGSFERGLAALKSVSEGTARANAEPGT